MKISINLELVSENGVILEIDSGLRADLAVVVTQRLRQVNDTISPYDLMSLLAKRDGIFIDKSDLSVHYDDVKL